MTFYTFMAYFLCFMAGVFAERLLGHHHRWTTWTLLDHGAFGGNTMRRTCVTCGRIQDADTSERNL